MKTFDIDAVPIKDRKMMRDMNSKAIRSTDVEGLQAYKDRKKTMEEIKQTVEEVRDLKNEINTMKDDLTTIKNLLLGLKQ